MQLLEENDEKCWRKQLLPCARACTERERRRRSQPQVLVGAAGESSLLYAVIYIYKSSPLLGCFCVSSRFANPFLKVQHASMHAAPDVGVVDEGGEPNL